MTGDKTTAESVLLIGDGNLAYSVASAMLIAGQQVMLLAADHDAARSAIQRNTPQTAGQLDLRFELPDTVACQLVVVVNGESVAEKEKAICQLECRIADDAIIAINTDSIALDELQQGSRFPSRILGLNWAYPAHKTFFAEIICNAVSDGRQVDCLARQAKEKWGKDPYTVSSGFSVRARMFAAMVREAAYLVENGYATIESIDRACRNDVGYYLPFVGNFRYMDLMGTYAYGRVMEDLNPDLSNAAELPLWVKQLSEAGGNGMSSGRGFYRYEDGAARRWEEIHQGFSNEIMALMKKYNHEEAIDR